MLAVPGSVEQLTTDYLSGALAAVSGGDSVVAITHEPVGVGIGLVGELFRLTLDWAGDTDLETVVAKMAAPTEDGRFVPMVLGMYEKEVAFYQTLGAESGLPTPAHYFSDFNPENHEFVLLIEDMTGSRTIDQIEGCDMDTAMLAVERLAAFHSRWWDSADLDNYEWLWPSDDERFAPLVAGSFQQNWAPAVELMGQHVDAKLQSLGDVFHEKYGAICAALSAGPTTFCHGDYRVENFFLQAGTDRPFTVCDWQLVARSRGPRDLAYFGQSLTIENRRAHEKEMVQRYVEVLAAGGVDGYDFNTAWHDYRVATLYCLPYPVIAGAGLDNHDERSLALPTAMMERCAAAIDDLDCYSLDVVK